MQSMNMYMYMYMYGLDGMTNPRDTSYTWCGSIYDTYVEIMKSEMRRTSREIRKKKEAKDEWEKRVADGWAGETLSLRSRFR